MRSDRIYRIFRIIFSVFLKGTSCGCNAGRNRWGSVAGGGARRRGVIRILFRA